jgi:hypothetical protein
MAKNISMLMSHWYTLIEGMQESPQHFYGSLEQAIKKRQLSDIEISRIDYKESGVLSANREYFRVERKEHIFDICAAPFGTGFFVSWRLGEDLPSPIIPTIATIFIFGALISQFGLIMAPIIMVVAFFVLGMFISEGKISWYREILAIPLIGPAMERLFHPMSYYRIDTALMFQESIRLAVLEVLDEMTKAKGLRVLSESERKPILSSLIKGMSFR